MRRRIAWGYSSAGRALEWHSRGQRFDPAYLHHPNGRGFRLSRFFFLCRVSPAASAAEQGGRGSPLPSPRLPPRPTRPQSGPTARKAAPQPASMRIGRNGRPTHRRRRETRGAPAFVSLAVRFFNSSRGCHAARRKKIRPQAAPFSRRYSLRAPLDDNHGSRKHDDGENACAGRRGAEAPRSGRFLAPTIPAEPRFRMPVRSNAPPRQNGRTQTACQKRIRLPAKHIKPKWIYGY